MANTLNDRAEEIKGIRHDRKYKYLYRILIGITVVGVATSIGFLIFDPTQPNLPSDYVLSLYTSILGIFATVMILDVLAERRDEQNRIERLLYSLKSQSQDVAKASLDELRDMGLAEGDESKLIGANLRYAKWAGIDLWHANLQNAYLHHADLENAVLWKTDLRGADLLGANLTGAKIEGACFDEAILPDGSNFNNASDLEKFINGDWKGYDLYAKDLHGSKAYRKANLKRAVMRSCNLRHSDLQYADLTNAILYLADLRGAKLQGTNLTGAELGRAQIDSTTEVDSTTTLPDGMKWHSDDDWDKFVDQTWRSDDKKSPAYRREKEFDCRDNKRIK